MDLSHSGSLLTNFQKVRERKITTKNRRISLVRTKLKNAKMPLIRKKEHVDTLMLKNTNNGRNTPT